jgi:hypothetical protein
MNKRKKYTILGITFALIILDFLALDDITTGSEPSYWKEWDILLFSLIIYALIIYANHNGVLDWVKKKFTNS